MVVALVWVLVHIIVRIWEIRPKCRGGSAETSTDLVIVNEGNLIGTFKGSR